MGARLVDSTLGPLVAIAPRDRYEDVVLGFEIVGKDGDGATFNTDWPRKHSFPNFWFNVLEYFSRRQGNARDHHSPGSPVELRLAGRTGTLEVELPSGTYRQIELASPGQLDFHETSELGVYAVSEKGKVVKSVCG